MNRVLTRANAGDESRFSRLWPLLGLIFLPNIGGPLAALLQGHPTPLRLGMVLCGLVLFLALYLWDTWTNDLSRVVYPAPRQQAAGRWRWVPVALLVGVCVALILGDGPRWLVLLIFASAVAGGRFALGQSIRAVAALAILVVLLGWLTRDSGSDLASAAFWTGMAGVLTIIINHFRRTNRALHDAREENARLAVEAERLRFARDLHDLLGHDLARIALQSEVAEALVAADPERAGMAMREVAEAARTALQEVRAAVAGYRQPTLASELRAAREILTAAGIAFDYEDMDVAIPPSVEAVLAWAVREGVTNVVKHSRARRCTIRLTRDEGHVGVEVLDDGAGASAAAASAPAKGPFGVGLAGAGGVGLPGGNGLPGLAERVAALGGRCEAGAHPGGGFRLAVVLPLTKGVEAAGTTADQAAEAADTMADRSVAPAVTAMGRGERA